MSKPIKKYIALAEIRRFIADYMYSEGCDCCENTEEHSEARAQIAKLLHIPMYKDKSGYNFYKFRTNRKQKT